MGVQAMKDHQPEHARVDQRERAICGTTHCDLPYRGELSRY